MVTGQSVVAGSVSSTIALPAVVDLDAIDAVRELLLEGIEGGPVSLDAAAVDRVSTNGLLLLLSAAETARRNNTGFAITEPSAALSNAIARLGLEPQFAGLLQG